MGKWGGGGRRALAVVRACFGYESRGSRSVAVQILKPGRAPSREKGKATAERAPGPHPVRLWGEGSNGAGGRSRKGEFCSSRADLFSLDGLRERRAIDCPSFSWHGPMSLLTAPACLRHQIISNSTKKTQIISNLIRFI